MHVYTVNTEVIKYGSP